MKSQGSSMRVTVSHVIASSVAALMLVMAAPPAHSQLLMIRDDPTDTGAEPSSPPVAWESPDIWISQNSIPGYRPVVFNTATPPGWYTTYLTALGSASNEEAEYRDPLGSNPNFLYVWVRNISATPSTGNEVLRVYWARASAGLSWPANFERSFGLLGGCPVPTTWPNAYYNSDEITKPRKNAAKATATERMEYVQAIQEIANTADASVKFSDNVTYWTKQDQIHGTAGVPSHLNRRFLPWHREFIARYEILLQTRRPGLTLLYWDWNTNPRSAQNDPVTATPFNFFTASFMGQSGDGGMWGELIGTPFASFYEPAQNCALSRNELFFNVVNGAVTCCGGCGGLAGPLVNYTLPTQAVVRKTRVGNPTSFGVALDSTVHAKTKYWNMAVSGAGMSEEVTGDDFANPNVVAATGFAKTLEYSAHNGSHGYFSFQLATAPCVVDCDAAAGCQFCPFGNQAFPLSAAEDPFFFLLHANCDRLWARWQRNSGMNSARYNLDDAYDDITSAGFHTTPFAPWDGTTGIVPWTSTPGDYTFSKTPDHESILTPPIYDGPDFQPTASSPTAANLDTSSRLRIPVLGANQSVILQIPWYPPVPLPCGSQPNHFCLLARIEENPVSPYGMTGGGVIPPEGPAIGANVVNNRRIAWRNVSVLNNFPGFLLMLGGLNIRNTSEAALTTGLRFALPPLGATSNLFNFGEVLVELGPALYRAWQDGGFQGEGVRPANEPNTVQLLSPQAQITNLRMGPGQAELVQVGLRLRPGYPSPGGTIHELQILQVGAPNNPNAVVGGQTLKFDLNQLTLRARKSEWRYWAASSSPGPNWMQPAYNDSEWAMGKAPLGYGDPVTTTIPQVAPGTTYYRSRFRVDDLALIESMELKLRADDGAVVWLNGREIARRNMSTGAVFHVTPAAMPAEGVQEGVYFCIPVPNARQWLSNGVNLVAVEVHQHTDGRTDSTFDLEVAANRTPLNEPPAVKFDSLTGITYAQAGLTIPVAASAADSQDGVEAVLLRYGTNVVALQRTSDATYKGALPGQVPGNYPLTLEAIDTRGRRNQSYATLCVLSNCPPEISFLSPLNGSSHPEGSVELAVNVSDASDAISRVIYSISSTITWNPTLAFTATNTVPPFTTMAPSLPPGHYIAYAIAIDSRNGAGHAIPSHFHVHETVPLILRIAFVGGEVQVSWDDPAAQLEASSGLGPQAAWGLVPGATSPFIIPSPMGSVFYRLRLDHPHQH